MSFIKKNSTNIIFYTSSLIIVTLPLKGNYNSISIILFLFSSMLILFCNKNIKFIKPSKSLFLLVLPFIYLIFQGFYSNIDIYLKNLIRSLSILIFPIFFFYLTQCVNILSIKKKIMNVLIYSSIIYSLYLVIIAFYRQIKYSPNFEKINWYFFTYHDFTEALDIQPTYLGLYNCLAITVLLLRLFQTNNKILKNTVFISFLTIIILLSGSRISLLSLIFIFGYLIFKHYNILSKKIKYAGVLMLVFIPLGVFIYVPIVKERMIDMTFGLKETFLYAKYGTNTKYAGGINPRLEMWDCAFKITKNKIILGNGYGYTQELLNDCYRSKGFNNFADLEYQTHNLYFSYYARGGILGLMTLLILYFYSFYNSWITNNLLHTSFIFLIIITSITENILNLQFGIVFFAFFNSLFFFPNRKNNNLNE